MNILKLSLLAAAVFGGRKKLIELHEYAEQEKDIKIKNEYVVTVGETLTDDEYDAHVGEVTTTFNRAEFLGHFKIGKFRGYTIRLPKRHKNIMEELQAMEHIVGAEYNQLYYGIPVPEPRFHPKRTDEKLQRKMDLLHMFSKNEQWKHYHKLKKNGQIKTPKQESARRLLRSFANAKEDICSLQTGATWGISRTAQENPTDNGEYAYKLNGEGVRAYIVDTGVYMEHSEFGGRCEWVADTAEDPSPRTDTNGHGTHVAGTILSKEYGLAKNAECKAVRVLGTNGSGTTLGVIAGIQATVEDNDKYTKREKSLKAVANMSLGGGYSAALNRAVEAAVESGIVYVVAAGNEAQNACNVSPSSSESAITVACSDRDDDICYFSNWGKCTDLFAPGYSITSTWIGSEYAESTISGTSMSSPHVAGVVAKLLASGNYKTVAEVKARVLELSHADKVSIPDNQVSGVTPNKMLFMDCDNE